MNVAKLNVVDELFRRLQNDNIVSKSSDPQLGAGPEARVVLGAGHSGDWLRFYSMPGRSWRSTLNVAPQAC